MSEQDRSPARDHLDPRVRVVQIFLAALALLLPLRMLSLITRSSVFSSYDYFEMVPQVVGPDGSIIWSGFFTHQNDHLVALPKLVFVVNIWLFSGSNVSLGVIVWVLALVVGAVLVWGLWSYLPTRGWNLTVVCWLFAAYLVPLQGQHNFRLAMSGASWILANVFAVGAIALLVRGRPVGAGVSGALATLTYGTGLALWPALVVVTALRRRFGRGEAAMFSLGALSIAVQRLTADADRASFWTWDLITVARSMAVTLGALLTSEPDTAAILGAAAFGVTAVTLARLGHCVRSDGSLILIGILVYTTVGLAMFAVSRGIFGDDMFLSSRYMTFAALFMLASSVLLLSVAESSFVVRALVLVVAATTVMASAATTVRFDQRQLDADRQMVAAHMGVGVGVVPLYSEATDAAFRASGHLPFHDRFVGDCGLFGDALDPGQLAIDPTVTGSLEEARPPRVGSGGLGPVDVDVVPAVQVSGWVAAAGPIECVIFQGDDDRVSGIALVESPRLDVQPGGEVPESVAWGWSGYVTSATDSGRVLVKLSDDDRFFVIDRFSVG